MLARYQRHSSQNQGWGSHVTGGAGGQVINVTTLNDSGAGSLRDALTTPGRRVIRVMVQGLISPLEPIIVTAGDFTLTGKFAIGGGACVGRMAAVTTLDDAMVVIDDCRNFIIEQKRFRVGASNKVGGTTSRDSMSIRGGSRNFRVSNCSFTFGVDGNLDISEACSHFTVERCLIALGLDRSNHTEGRHSTGGLNDGSNHCTFRDCVWAYNDYRNPHMGTVVGPIPANIELINCIVYRFGRECISRGDGFSGANVLGCRFMQTSPDTDIFVAGGDQNNSIYVFDCIDDVHRTSDGQPQVAIAGAFPDLVSATPFLGSGNVTIRRALEVEATVLPFAGAILPKRDAIDTAIVNGIIARTGTIVHAVESGEVTVGEVVVGQPPLNTPNVAQSVANPWLAWGIFAQQVAAILSSPIAQAVADVFSTGPAQAAVALKRVRTSATSIIVFTATTSAKLKGMKAIASSIGEFITTPEFHGWGNSPNTPVSNTVAFQAAIDNASANAGSSSTGRGVVQLTPSKLYEVFGTPGGARDPNGCLMLDGIAQANVEIRTQGKPTGVPTETRATIKLHASVDDAFASNTFGSLCVFELKGNTAENIWLTHVIVDGNKFGIAEPTVAHVALGDNGGLHAIGIDGAINIRLEHVAAKNGYTDGLRIKAWINPPSGGPQHAQNIACVDCDFHNNRRQGVSIVDCGLTTLTWDQVVFTRCKFRDTGDEGAAVGGIWPFTTAGYPGQRPGAGLDMEPNNQSQSINGVTIDDCTFNGNGPTSWQNDAQIATQGSRALVTDLGSSGSGSANRYLKVLNNSFINNQNNFDEIGLILRQDGTVNNWSIIEHAIISGNVHVSGDYFCEGFPDQTPTLPNRSMMVDVLIENNVIDTMLFRRLVPTGNSVTINGNTRPGGGATGIDNSGLQTIGASPFLPVSLLFAQAPIDADVISSPSTLFTQMATAALGVTGIRHNALMTRAEVLAGNFTVYDAQWTAMTNAGLKLCLTFFDGSAGATAYPGDDPNASVAAAERTAWANLARDIAAYCVANHPGLLTMVEVWNEPNGNWPIPADRMVLLIAAVKTAIRGNPNLNSIAIVAPATTGDAGSYWQTLIDNGVMNQIDWVSLHIYSSPHVFARRLANHRTKMAQVGAQARPIVISEWGAKSSTSAHEIASGLTMLKAHGATAGSYFPVRDFGTFPDQGLLNSNGSLAEQGTVWKIWQSTVGESSTYLGQDSLPFNVECHHFLVAGQHVRVAWASQDTPSISIAGSYTAKDVNGATITAGATQSLSTSPIYLMGNITVTFTAGQDALLAGNAEQFSLVQGQDGWTYQWLLSGVYTNATPDEAAEDWARSGSTFWQIGTTNMHPAVSGGVPVYAVRKWLVPSGTSRVKVTGTWSRSSGSGDGSDITLLHNTTQRFRRAALIGATANIDQIFDVTPGDILEFRTGTGPAASDANDNTSLNALIYQTADATNSPDIS